MAASSQAVRRLARELEHLQRQGNPQVSVRPTSRSMLEWHFVLHSLPADTPYHGGVFHGRLLFPEQYPLAPPSLIMLTPSGRFETQQRLCLSMTDFHPESWNPAWTVESILVGLISFMVDERDPVSFGMLNDTAEARRAFAGASMDFNAANKDFCELFPEFLECRSGPAAGGDGHSAATEPDPPAPPEEDSADSVPQEHAEGEDAPAAAAAACSVESATRAEPSAPGHGGDEEVGVAAPAPLGAVPDREDEEEGPARVRTSQSLDETESAADECWICREDASREPLIQPCACRGSMSGVHASCVEAWINHHRTNSLNNAVPSCSVCNQPYSGTERRPGLLSFVGHLCKDFLRQAVRSAVLIGLLVAYWAAGQPDLLALWIRIFLFTASGSFFLYKALTLAASLPRGRAPPENALRRFFVGDFRMVAVHAAETIAIVTIAAMWYIYNQLEYYYVLPIGLLIVLPAISALAHQRRLLFSHYWCILTAMVLASPIFIVLHVGKVILRNPWRLVDPLDGLIHTWFAIAAVLLSWFCPTNQPVVILWLVHSAALLAGIAEKGLLRRLQWKEGRTWLIFMQLAVLAAYMANMLHNFSDSTLHEASSMLMIALSLVWLLLSCTLAIAVNWNVCVRQYHAWQNRHGSFSLSASSPPGPRTIGVVMEEQTATAGTAVGAIVPQHDVVEV